MDRRQKRNEFAESGGTGGDGAMARRASAPFTVRPNTSAAKVSVERVWTLPAVRCNGR